MFKTSEVKGQISTMDEDNEQLNKLIDLKEDATFRDYMESWLDLINEEVIKSNDFILSVNQKKEILKYKI